MTQISRKVALELIIQMHKLIVFKMDLWKYFDDYKDAHMSGLKLTELDPLLDLIEVELEGVSNGYLTQFFRTIIGCDIEVCGEVEKRYSCPCCGYKTLDEIYDSSKGTGYDICPYCNWEDDGTTDISAQTSINHGSIQDYRDKIKNNPNKYYIDKWLK